VRLAPTTLELLPGESGLPGSSAFDKAPSRRNYSFAPLGARAFSTCTEGLRPGLHFHAALRLIFRLLAFHVSDWDRVVIRIRKSGDEKPKIDAFSTCAPALASVREELVSSHLRTRPVSSLPRAGACPELSRRALGCNIPPLRGCATCASECCLTRAWPVLPKPRAKPRGKSKGRPPHTTSRQRLHLHTQHRRQIAHNRIPAISRIGGGVHLAAGRPEINSAFI
jgi:hypothetical protein